MLAAFQSAVRILQQQATQISDDVKEMKEELNRVRKKTLEKCAMASEILSMGRMPMMATQHRLARRGSRQGGRHRESLQISDALEGTASTPDMGPGPRAGVSHARNSQPHERGEVETRVHRCIQVVRPVVGAYYQEQRVVPFRSSSRRICRKGRHRILQGAAIKPVLRTKGVG